jgi:hypothetical protein
MYEQFDGIVGEYNKLGEKLKNFYRAHNTILQIYKKNPLYLGNEKKAIATEIKKKNSEIINEITEHNINTDFDENN